MNVSKSILFAAIAVVFTGCIDDGVITYDKGGDVDRYLNIYAGRPESYTLTVEASPPEGGSVLCNPPGQAGYVAGTEITLTAVANKDYSFAGWSRAPTGVDTSGQSITFNINSDLVLTAKFQKIVVPDGYCALTVNAGNGGTVDPSGTSIRASGSQITVTAAPSSDYAFTGWTGAPQGVNAASESITFSINENTVLTANFRLQIDGTDVPGANITEKLKWLDRSAESHNAYIVEVKRNETIAPHTFQYSGAINITVLLIGDGVNRTIKLSSHGTMFTVRSNVTLILGNNITLQGHSGNTGSMVYVNGGIFRMNAGSTIKGNNEAGVNAYSGTFEMTGGTISGNNTSTNGGGVYMNGAAFTMTGGTISGNTASNGGGVYVYSGTFTMTGGNISGNKADKRGGGVYDYSTFNMHGGAIMGNTAAEYGGGVYVVSSYNTFNKTGGGTITGYSSDQNNGNVVKDYSGVLARRGHAVYVNENRHKEATAGPDVNLSSSENTGWDM